MDSYIDNIEVNPFEDLKLQMIKDGCYRADGYLKPQWVQTAEQNYDLSKVPGITLSEKLFVILKNNGKQDSCIICGKPSRFWNFAKGYFKTCSDECKLIRDRQSIHLAFEKSQFPEVYEKIKKTNLERYGTPYPMQSDIVKQRAKEGCEEKYGEGIINPFQAPEVKQKIQSTLIKNYGVTNPSYSSVIKKKIFSRKGKMTNPEKLYKDFLEENSFEYKYNFEYEGKNFDFAVFKEGKLNTLIEIDGELYHGLRKDRDNKQSQGFTDYKRFRILKEDIKLFVVDSERVKESFSTFKEIYNMSYAEYIQKMKDIFPKEFPYYNFSEKRLKGDYWRLCNYFEEKPYKVSKSRIGESSILKFCKSLFFVSRNNLPSIKEAWGNRNLINKLIDEKYLYYSNFSSHSVLEGFQECPYVYKEEFNSPSLIRKIFQKYLVNESIIYDPKSDPSNLLAASSLNKKYFTICKNSLLKKELEEIINFHNIEGVSFKDNFEKEDIPVLVAMIDSVEEMNYYLNNFKSKKFLFLTTKNIENYTEKFWTEKNKTFLEVIVV